MQKRINEAANNKENVNYKDSCPCKRSSFARIPDRPPLAGIQGFNQAIRKAKSIDIPSPIKFLENVRPSEAKAPPKIKVRSVTSLNTKSTQPLAARKSSPCRCLFNAKSNSKDYGIDDVFLPPTTSTFISQMVKPEQPSGAAKSTRKEASSDSTKPIPRSTLDSYTSIVTLPPTREESNLLKRTSISAKMTLETSQQDSAKSCKVVVDSDEAVKSNVPLRRRNSDVTTQKEHSRRPAVKTSLLKRRSGSIKKLINFPILYSPEYSEGIINYLYLNKNNNLLQNEWVTMYIAKRHRTEILNWLLEISEHYFPQFEAPYNMAVRLMDYIIVKSTLQSSQYQLAAVAALWLAGKFLDGNPRLNKATKLFALCSGKYSTDQILAMERNILTTVGFCLNLPDPLDFLFNYLELSNLENDKKLILSSKFIIHCASLFESYCLVTPAFLAASALYMALQVVRNEREVHVYFLWYEPDRIKYFIEHVLKVNVKYSLMHKYTPVRRYKEVARLFFNI